MEGARCGIARGSRRRPHNRVLDKAAEAGTALQTAAELAEDAQRHPLFAAEGSLQADVETTNAQFAEVVRSTRELHQFLGAGISGVESILHRLELVGDAPPTGAASGTPAPLSAPASPARGSREHIEELRRDQPPPVQPRSGQKTHGSWFTNTDDRDAPIRKMTSGEDELYEVAKRHFVEIGVPGTPVTAVDVEVKLAVHMARNNIQHARAASGATRWYRLCFPKAAP